MASNGSNGAASQEGSHGAHATAQYETKPGYEGYVNNQAFSDITIKYSDRTFYGHKIILSGQSHWFKAAFNGKFAESDTKELTLQEDNPDTVEHMLLQAYVDPRERNIRINHASIDDLQDTLAFFQVADKYQFPELRSLAIEEFTVNFGDYLKDVVAKPGNIATRPDDVNDFCDIFRAVYSVTGADSSSPIVRTMMPAVEDNETSGFIGARNKVSQHMYKEAAKVVPEFGRDLFMGIMDQVEHGTDRNSTVFISYTQRVECPECTDVWLKPTSSYYGGHCFSCGEYLEGWHEYAES